MRRVFDELNPRTECLTATGDKGMWFRSLKFMKLLSVCARFRPEQIIAMVCSSPESCDGTVAAGRVANAVNAVVRFCPDLHRSIDDTGRLA